MTCQKTWSGTENKAHIDHNKWKDMHGVIKRLGNTYCNKEITKNYELPAEHGTHTKIDRSWTILQIIHHYIVSSQKKYLNRKSHS